MAIFVPRMLEKIRGIVLKTIKYGDSSLIVDVFTESHGRMSFITAISHARHSSSHVFWRVLNQVEFSADVRSVAKLTRPKDVRLYYNYTSLPYDPVKSSLALFVADFLCGVLRGNIDNALLYKYSEMSLRWLDMCDDASNNKGVSNFHLVFLMRVTRFLGIYPNLDGSSDIFDRRRDVRNMYFDLLAGEYTYSLPSHRHFLMPDEACKMPLLFRMDYGTMRVVRFKRKQRVRCLEVLLEYYRLHVPQFPVLKSLDVLAELFD